MLYLRYCSFLQSIDIEHGLKTLEQSDADFAFSVTSFASPIQRAIKTKATVEEMFDQSKFQMRSQDLHEAYHDAGQFYWGTKDAGFLAYRFLAKPVPVQLPSIVFKISTPQKIGTRLN